MPRTYSNIPEPRYVEKAKTVEGGGGGLSLVGYVRVATKSKSINAAASVIFKQNPTSSQGDVDLTYYMPDGAVSASPIEYDYMTLSGMFNDAPDKLIFKNIQARKDNFYFALYNSSGSAVSVGSALECAILCALYK